MLSKIRKKKWTIVTMYAQIYLHLKRTGNTQTEKKSKPISRYSYKHDCMYTKDTETELCDGTQNLFYLALH